MKPLLILFIRRSTGMKKGAVVRLLNIKPNKDAPLPICRVCSVFPAPSKF